MTEPRPNINAAVTVVWILKPTSWVYMGLKKNSGVRTMNSDWIMLGHISFSTAKCGHIL